MIQRAGGQCRGIGLGIDNVRHHWRCTVGSKVTVGAHRVESIGNRGFRGDDIGRLRYCAKAAQGGHRPAPVAL